MDGSRGDVLYTGTLVAESDDAKQARTLLWLLGEAEASDPDGRMLQNYLTSESGRVYLLLAHASGRLR